MRCSPFHNDYNLSGSLIRGVKYCVSIKQGVLWTRNTLDSRSDVSLTFYKSFFQLKESVS